MASTPQLLDPIDLDKYIKTIEITQGSFINDKQEQVKYNQILIVLDNGQEIVLKLDKINKLAIFYAIAQLDASAK